MLFNYCLHRANPVLSGGPQRSHLRPIFSSQFVKILLFADDVKVYHSFDSLTDMHFLQVALNNLVTCSEINGMTLNIKKYKKLPLSWVSLLSMAYGNDVLKSIML